MRKKIAVSLLALFLVFGLYHPGISYSQAAGYGTTFTDPSTDNFSIALNAGTTGTGTYAGTAQVTATAQTTVALQVAWGTSSTSLSNLTEVYLANTQTVLGSYNLTASGPDSSVNVGFNLSNLPNNAVYYYAYVDPSSPTSRFTNVLSFTLGTPSVAPVSPQPTGNNPTGTLVDTSVSGIYVVPNAGGIHTATSFTGYGEIYSVQPETVNLEIMWGQTPTTMTNTATLYLQDSTIPLGSYVLDGNGDKVAVMFTVNGLTGLNTGTTYYYEYVNGSSPSILYTGPISMVVYGSNTATTTATTIQQSATGTGLLSGMVATTATNAPAIGSLVPCDGGTSNPCTFASVFTLINNVVHFLILLTIPIAGIIIAYIGFTFLASGGSEEARGKAKHALWNLVIGFICVLGAYVIVATILTALGVDSAYKLF